MAFTSFKILQNDFVHHIDVQVKILKPSPFKYISIFILRDGHCNENHLAKLTYVISKWVHSTMYNVVCKLVIEKKWNFNIGNFITREKTKEVKISCQRCEQKW
jgi:hypothetical protein